MKGISGKLTAVGTIDLRPSPYGYARMLATILEAGDGKGKADALTEIVRMFTALWKNDYDFHNDRWWDSKSDLGRGPTYMDVLYDEYPWGDA